MTKTAFTAPHFLASECGASILNAGGTAVDAMVAAAAMIAVQYPHMNSLGGDGFWLIQEKDSAPVAIDACGKSAAGIQLENYRQLCGDTMVTRGSKAALTMAGTVSGWKLAREHSAKTFPSLPLTQLLAPAIQACTQGIESTQSLRMAIDKCHQDFSSAAEFERYRKLYVDLAPAEKIKNVGLARLLSDLAEQGLDAFYRGNIAETLAAALTRQGSPIQLDDFHAFEACFVEPLQVRIHKGELFNLPAPSQGLASLLILAIFDRLYQPDWTEAQAVHALVEATKQAFIVRDREVLDPTRLSQNWPNLLSDAHIQTLVDKVDMAQAMVWPRPNAAGDTVWMGAVDRYGTMVSFIQSIYWEFGSGCVIPEYGLVWNNRGSSFSLDPTHPNVLAPNTKPFHTLNPALANLKDGSRMVYGTMGGEGQPQTQAAIMYRAIYKNLGLAQAIDAPRWLLGRTWGEESHDLKMESSLFKTLAPELQNKGHGLNEIAGFSELMGHAGAIRLFNNGDIEAASDHRSDGAAIIV